MESGGEESNDYGNGTAKNKMRKQEVERKRRLRMASALDQIKEILQDNTDCDLKKADKVEILESTVKFLKERKQSQQEDSFCSGYNSCLVEMSGSLMTADDIDYNTKSTLLMLISKMSTARHTAPAKKLQDEKKRNIQQQQQQQTSVVKQQTYQPKDAQQTSYPQQNIKQEPSEPHKNYARSTSQDRQNDYNHHQSQAQANFRQDPSYSGQRYHTREAPRQQNNYNQSYTNKQEYNPSSYNGNYRQQHPQQEQQHCNFKQPINENVISPLPSPVYPSHRMPQYHQHHSQQHSTNNWSEPVTLHQPYNQNEKRSPLSNIKNINTSPPTKQQIVVKKQTKGMKRCHSDTTMEKENFKKSRMEERPAAIPTSTKIDFKPSPIENQTFHFPINGAISVPGNHTIDNTNIAVLQKNAEGKFTRISNIPLKALLGNIEVFKTKDLNSLSDVKIRPKQLSASKPTSANRTADQGSRINQTLSSSHPNGFSYMKLLQEENLDSEGLQKVQCENKCQLISMPPIGAYIVDP